MRIWVRRRENDSWRGCEERMVVAGAMRDAVTSQNVAVGNGVDKVATR